MSHCIYCRGPTRNEPEEHIFPEGLVGDTPIKVPFPNGEVIERRIVLYDSEVCKKCNIALGRLDQHLQQQLGLFKVLINRDKTKGGRAPRVEKPGMIAKRDEGGISIHLNLTNKATKTPDGMIVTCPPKTGPGCMLEFEPGSEPGGEVRHGEEETSGGGDHPQAA